VTAVVFSPDGKSVAIMSSHGFFVDTLQLFDIDSGTARWKHSADVSAVSFNADGSLLAVAGDCKAKVLDADDGYVVMRCRVPGDGYSGTQTSISPDGTSLTAVWGRVVRVYDVWSRDGAFGLREETWSVPLSASCYCLRYSPDGTLIATLGDGRRGPEGPDPLRSDGRRRSQARWKPRRPSIGIYVWDAASFQLQAMWRAPAETNQIQFGGCSHVLVTAGRDSVIRAWDVASGTLTALCDTAPDTAGTKWLTLGDGSGRVALTRCTDGTLRVWDVTTGLERTRLPTPQRFRLGAVNSDATKLATSSKRTKSVEIWSLAGGAQQQPAPDAAAPDYWCPRCSAG
jgi:WD40 repeat protein